MVFNDSDIKIASDKPSLDIKKNNIKAETVFNQSECYKKASEWGTKVAREFINDANKNPLNEESDYEMTGTSAVLLSRSSFTGTTRPTFASAGLLPCSISISERLSFDRKHDKMAAESREGREAVEKGAHP